MKYIPPTYAQNAQIVQKAQNAQNLQNALNEEDTFEKPS